MLLHKSLHRKPPTRRLQPPSPCPSGGELLGLGLTPPLPSTPGATSCCLNWGHSPEAEKIQSPIERGQFLVAAPTTMSFSACQNASMSLAQKNALILHTKGRKKGGFANISAAHLLGSVCPSQCSPCHLPVPQDLTATAPGYAPSSRGTRYCGRSFSQSSLAG